MPPSIGSNNFDFLRGEMPLRRVEVASINAAGEDGNATQNRGVRARQVTMIAINHVSSAGAIKTNSENYADDVGDVVSMTDDFGNLYTNLEIIDVETLDGDGMTGPMAVSTDGANYRHVTRWTLIKKS